MRQVFGHAMRPRVAAVAAGVAAALLISACGSSSSGGSGGGSGGGAAKAGGSATFALPPAATPNWIFPIGTPGHLASYNGSIQAEMYLPLYNYDTTSGTLAIDESASAAQAPVYSSDDKTVTITLNNLTWSNGKKLTSRDVQFWYNLVKAGKSQWGAYSPGQMPDNISSFTVVNDQTFRLQLTKAYNPGWFTANQLSLITPIPQSAWDVTSDGGQAGNYDGEATVGYGPVPQTPVSSYLSPTQKNNPYPFDITKAKALLTSHGWTITGGVATCTNPGLCGSGVKAGTKLQMSIISESGSTETTNMMQELQSSFSQIGVSLSIKQVPLNTVLNDSAICTPSQPACSWQLSFFGTQGSWYYPAYPSGEQIFASSAGVNLGSYSDGQADTLIQQSTSSSSASAMQAYSAYLAQNLPVIWVPNPDYQVSAIKNTLGGVLQDPLASMNPQQWYKTS